MIFIFPNLHKKLGKKFESIKLLKFVMSILTIIHILISMMEVTLKFSDLVVVMQ